MISISQQGDYSKITRYLQSLKKKANFRVLDEYGNRGVEALASATPVDTGLTASSWYYEIERDDKYVRISFCNSNIQNGVPIAIILDYGHGTRNGGWVEGRNYIHPSIQPLFDEIVNDAWKEVTSL